MSNKILIVDDSRTVRLQLSKILTDAGFETFEASGGREALSCVEQVGPHLLILDIQMPDMDGYAVCEQLKQKGEPYSRLPVVFLTSLESRALDLLGDAMGAYLQKPVAPAELVAVVNRFMEPQPTLR